MKINEPALLENGSLSVSAMVDRIETDSSKPGKHLLNIYIRAVNTGKKPVQLVWYSRITDMTGKSLGGIGISHAGSGARTRLLDPGSSETARDYIAIESDADVAALSKGATLNVAFVGQQPEGSPVAVFEAAWTVDPGRIR